MNAQVCVCRPKEEGWCVCVCVGWHTHTLSVWSQAISGFCCLYCSCLTLDCMMCYRPITETHWGQTRQSLTSPVLFFTRTNKTFFFFKSGMNKEMFNKWESGIFLYLTPLFLSPPSPPRSCRTATVFFSFCFLSLSHSFPLESVCCLKKICFSEWNAICTEMGR